ncbi:MAG: hypothetical protein ABR980_03995 [Ignavibacteriaceae bacterium]|jgi:hypothetical protein
MELQNLFQKKIKRKNFFLTIAVTTTGFIVMRTALFKMFGKKFIKNYSGLGNIKVKINSLAVSRKKLPAGQTKIGDTNG